MDQHLRENIEQFVEQNIVAIFHRRRLEKLAVLRLKDVLEAKNPYLFRAKRLESAGQLVSAILDARLSSSEEGIFGKFMEELAIFVASETGNGQKCPSPGIDIDLHRGDVRYLIAVKSGKSWGNSTSHKKQNENFDDAVRVLRQSGQAGHIQPTLGICYGKFKTTYRKRHLHIGGQSFWQLVSGERELYTEIIEPLGFKARESNEAFEVERERTYRRFTDEFRATYCLESGEIDWKKLVEFVSKNMA
jgi:hypothetical protein